MSFLSDRITVEDLNYCSKAREMTNAPNSHTILLYLVGSGRPLESREHQSGGDEECRGMPPLPSPNLIVTPHALCSTCRRALKESHLLARTQAKLDSRWIAMNTSPILEPEDSELDLKGDWATYFLGGNYHQCFFDIESTHHLSTMALRRSAENGCHLCALFWSNFVALPEWDLTDLIIDPVHYDHPPGRERETHDILSQLSDVAFARPLKMRVGTISKKSHAEPQFLVLYMRKPEKLPGLRSVLHIDTKPFWQRKSTRRCHLFLPATYCSQGAKTKARRAGARRF